MANFSDLPSEIWFLIAQYLPKSRLDKLRWLNSFFFNYWMDLEWREVHVQIDNFTSQTPIRLLRRVGDPFVAPRTKSMVIFTNSTVISPNSMTLDIALPALLRSLTLLPNLTSLIIHYATSHFSTLFQTITSSSLSRTLQTLKLRGHVKVFASLRGWCAHKSLLEDLTELDLSLHCNENDEDEEKSCLPLEPFLRSLAPTLRSLSISTTARLVNNLDISPLFDALSQPGSLVLFPNLKSLSLSFCIDSFFKSSLQSLRFFLLTNNNLQHLCLRSSADEKVFGEWLTDLINDDVHFPFLQSLHICPSNTESGLAALLTLIKRTASTLSSLDISGDFGGLRLENANRVVYALAERENPQLKSLHLNITCLSGFFIILLARKLPQLEKLTLWASQIVNSFYDLLLLRRYNPDNPCAKDVLHVWKLNDLEIYDDDFDSDIYNLDMDAVRAVAGAVPALARCLSEDDENF